MADNNVRVLFLDVAYKAVTISSLRIIMKNYFDKVSATEDILIMRSNNMRMMLMG